MHFWIVRTEYGGLIGIDNDNVITVDLTSLASNVGYFHWKADSGEIYYTDRMSLPERITDPVPYLWIVDQFLALGQLTELPLTLAQAKTVKRDAADACFNSKRQAPISYLSHNWDARDEEVIAMSVVLSGMLGPSSINAALLSNKSLANQILNARIGNSGISGTINRGLYEAAITLTGSVYEAVTQVVDVDYPSAQVSTSGTISWYPVDETAPVNLTVAQMLELLGSVVTRRANLDTFMRGKRAAIIACTTIDQIIAIDLTTGWPTA